MSIDTAAMLRIDLDDYILRTYKEGVMMLKKHQAVALESNTVLTAISTEGVLSWVKEKVVAIGRKFVALINKIVARFSKNREKLEANIKEYEKNPDSDIVLPISGKAIGYAIAATTAIAGAIVLIVKMRKNPENKAKIKEVWNKTLTKIKELKDKFLKRKDAKKEDCTVSAKEAKDLATKYHKANADAEKAVKDAANDMARDTTVNGVEDVAATGEAARAAADLAEQAGLMGSHMNNKAEAASGGASNPEKTLKKEFTRLIHGCIDKMEDSIERHNLSGGLLQKANELKAKHVDKLTNSLNGLISTKPTIQADDIKQLVYVGESDVRSIVEKFDKTLSTLIKDYSDQQEKIRAINARDDLSNRAEHFADQYTDKLVSRVRSEGVDRKGRAKLLSIVDEMNNKLNPLGRNKYGAYSTLEEAQDAIREIGDEYTQKFNDAVREIRSQQDESSPEDRRTDNTEVINRRINDISEDIIKNMKEALNHTELDGKDYRKAKQLLKKYSNEVRNKAKQLIRQSDADKPTESIHGANGPLVQIHDRFIDDLDRLEGR